MSDSPAGTAAPAPPVTSTPSAAGGDAVGASPSLSAAVAPTTSSAGLAAGGATATPSIGGAVAATPSSAGLDGRGRSSFSGGLPQAGAGAAGFEAYGGGGGGGGGAGGSFFGGGFEEPHQPFSKPGPFPNISSDTLMVRSPPVGDASQFSPYPKISAAALLGRPHIDLASTRAPGAASAALRTFGGGYGFDGVSSPPPTGGDHPDSTNTQHSWGPNSAISSSALLASSGRVLHPNAPLLAQPNISSAALAAGGKEESPADDSTAPKWGPDSAIASSALAGNIHKPDSTFLRTPHSSGSLAPHTHALTTTSRGPVAGAFTTGPLVGPDSPISSGSLVRAAAAAPGRPSPLEIVGQASAVSGSQWMDPSPHLSSAQPHIRASVVLAHGSTVASPSSHFSSSAVLAGKAPSSNQAGAHFDFSTSLPVVDPATLRRQRLGENPASYSPASTQPMHWSPASTTSTFSSAPSSAIALGSYRDRADEAPILIDDLPDGMAPLLADLQETFRQGPETSAALAATRSRPGNPAHFMMSELDRTRQMQFARRMQTYRCLPFGASPAVDATQHLLMPEQRTQSCPAPPASVMRRSEKYRTEEKEYASLETKCWKAETCFNLYRNQIEGAMRHVLDLKAIIDSGARPEDIHYVHCCLTQMLEPMLRVGAEMQAGGESAATDLQGLEKSAESSRANLAEHFLEECNTQAEEGDKLKATAATYKPLLKSMLRVLLPHIDAFENVPEDKRLLAEEYAITALTAVSGRQLTKRSPEVPAADTDGVAAPTAIDAAGNDEQ